MGDDLGEWEEEELGDVRADIEQDSQDSSENSAGELEQEEIDALLQKGEGPAEGGSKGRKESSSGGDDGSDEEDEEEDERPKGRRRREASDNEPIRGEKDKEGGGESDGGAEKEEKGGKKKEEDPQALSKRKEAKKAKLQKLKEKVKERKRLAREAAAAATGQPGTGGADGGEKQTTKEDHKGNSQQRGEDPMASAAFLWSRFKAIAADSLSDVEKEGEGWVRPAHIGTVPDFGRHTDAKLVGYIKSLCPKWKDMMEEEGDGEGEDPEKVAARRKKKKRKRGGVEAAAAATGSPSILVVCAGARRCVELLKHLSAFKSPVCKLFSKHMKADEQRKMLSNSGKRHWPVAVGTPARLRLLLSEPKGGGPNGVLSLAGTSLVVIDMHMDQKGRTVLDSHDTQGPVMAFLEEAARPRLERQEDALAAGAKGRGLLKLALY